MTAETGREISERLNALSPSPTLSINARAQALRAEGQDIINFSAGEPDFSTPEFVKSAAVEAIQADFTHYTPASGITELKKAVCEKLERDQGLVYRPDQVIVSTGAKHSLYNAMMALCNPGDGVLIPVPYWVTYPAQVKLAGGHVIPVKTGAEEGFRLTPERLREAPLDEARILILNSPNNPTGAVYSQRDLEGIAALAQEYDLWLISDEIYEALIYDGEHVSIASVDGELTQRTIVINGLSKSHAMTGWRLGYAAGPEAVIQAMGRFQGQVTSNPTSITQKAAVSALNGDGTAVNRMREAYRERRETLVSGLSTIDGMAVNRPAGAFYVFVRVDGWYGSTIGETVVTDSVSFSRALLEEAGVAVVPGSAFGDDRFVRMSYAIDIEQIQRGIERLKRLD